MSDVIRVTCPHRRVATFIRHEGVWGSVVTEVETVRDSDTGDFIEYRYPVRCDACGSRGIVADVTHDELNSTLNALAANLPALAHRGLLDHHGIPDIPLKMWADAVGSRRDRLGHAGT